MKHIENSKKFNLKRQLKTIAKFKKVYFLIILIGLTFLLAKSVLSLDYFTIEQVNIAGDFKYVNYSDLKIVSEKNALSKNSLTFNNSDFIDSLTSTFLYLKTVKSNISLPKTLVVSITERKPVALLSTEKDQSLYFIDGDGFVLGEAEESVTLPRIIMPSSPVNVEWGIFPLRILVSKELFSSS